MPRCDGIRTSSTRSWWLQLLLTHTMLKMLHSASRHTAPTRAATSTDSRSGFHGWPCRNSACPASRGYCRQACSPSQYPMASVLAPLVNCRYRVPRSRRVCGTNSVHCHSSKFTAGLDGGGGLGGSRDPPSLRVNTDVSPMPPLSLALLIHPK